MPSGYVSRLYTSSPNSRTSNCLARVTRRRHFSVAKLKHCYLSVRFTSAHLYINMYSIVIYQCALLKIAVETFRKYEHIVSPIDLRLQDCLSIVLFMCSGLNVANNKGLFRVINWNIPFPQLLCTFHRNTNCSDTTYKGEFQGSVVD